MWQRITTTITSLTWRGRVNRALTERIHHWLSLFLLFSVQCETGQTSRTTTVSQLMCVLRFKDKAGNTLHLHSHQLYSYRHCRPWSQRYRTKLHTYTHTHTVHYSQGRCIFQFNIYLLTYIRHIVIFIYSVNMTLILTPHSELFTITGVCVCVCEAELRSAHCCNTLLRTL